MKRIALPLFCLAFLVSFNYCSTRPAMQQEKKYKKIKKPTKNPESYIH